MYDSEKNCKDCGLIARYDSKQDTFKFSRYVFCPICGKKLKTDGYSPNI